MTLISGKKTILKFSNYKLQIAPNVEIGCKKRRDKNCKIFLGYFKD